MDPISPLLAFAIQNGVSGLLLVILVILAKHHGKTLEDHKKIVDGLNDEFKKELDRVQNEKNDLEKELREKIEELLKDQLAAQKPLTEALMEYNRLAKSLKRKRTDETD